MSDFLLSTTDARQYPAWLDFLGNLGWEKDRIGDIQIASKKLPILNKSLIKIQHPINPIPFEKN